MENKGYSILTYHAYTLIACLSLLYNKSIDTANVYNDTNVEDTMFQGFLKDAKNHYNEKLSQQMTLTKNS